MKSPRNRNLPVLAVAAPAPYAGPQEPLIPQNFAAPGLSIMQIFAILRAYKWHTLVIAVLVTIGTAAIIKMMPKSYAATTTLLMNSEGNDPLATNANANNGPAYNYLATEVQLMQSGEVLLPLIDKLGLAQNKDYTMGYKGDGSSLREWIRENLVKSFDIQLGPYGSQLIYVTATARFPTMAADLANTLSDIYLNQEEQRVSGPASERARRYAQELTELKDKVRVAQDQVTAFRQRTGVTAELAAPANDIEATLLASLEAHLQEAQNARRTAEVKYASEQHLSIGDAASAAVQGLKGELNALETQLAQLQTTFGPQHPKVLEMQRRIEATQRNLDEEMRSFSADAGSDLSAARELERKLHAAVEEQRAKVLNTNKLRDEGTKYALELESAQSVYKRALDGYDQIMFASGSHNSIMTIVSRAVPPQTTSKPNKSKLAFMGLLAGIAFGLVGPLCYELLVKRRVRCRDDFEHDFSIPVLIEFDRFVLAKSAAA